MLPAVPQCWIARQTYILTLYERTLDYWRTANQRSFPHRNMGTRYRERPYTIIINSPLLPAVPQCWIARQTYILTLYERTLDYWRTANQRSFPHRNMGTRYRYQVQNSVCMNLNFWCSCTNQYISVMGGPPLHSAK